MIYAIQNGDKLRIWVPKDADLEKQIILESYPKSPFVCEILGGMKEDLETLKKKIERWEIGGWYIDSAALRTYLIPDLRRFRERLDIKDTNPVEEEDVVKLCEPVVDAITSTSKNLVEEIKNYDYWLDYVIKEIQPTTLGDLEQWIKGKWGETRWKEIDQYMQASRMYTKQTIELAINPHQLDWMTREEKHWKYWFMILGSSRLRELGYKEKKIVKAVTELQNIEKIRREIHRVWKVGDRVKREEAKQTILGLYHKYGVDRRITSKEIYEYFDCKLISTTIGGEDLRVYKILGTK